jgi:hypothetical protein
MPPAVGPDRVEGDPIPIVEFGIVRRTGTNYARVGDPIANMRLTFRRKVLFRHTHASRFR